MAASLVVTDGKEEVAVRILDPLREVARATADIEVDVMAVA